MNETVLEIAADQGILEAKGLVTTFDGYSTLYTADKPVQDSESEEPTGELPNLSVGEQLHLLELKTEQNFTKPPARYNEASLVKALEENGIGRPSTYATIIQVLTRREYLHLESRRFYPTDVGRVVANFLSKHFTRYVDYEFTARLEDELDAVARGEKDWVPVLREFWDPFKALVDEKESSVTRAEATQGRVLGIDEKTGKEISVRLGRYGPFVQIGTKDDEEKPRFASLRAGQKMDSITLPEALKLFELPRNLGESPDGEAMSVGIGRFGPFVKAGSTYASIPAGVDPYEIGLEAAVELVRAKREAAANKIISSFQDGAIQVLRGKFGPYVTDGSKNGRIPKDVAPETLTEADCVEILASAPAKGKGKFGRKGGKPEAPKKTRTVKAKAEGAEKAPAKKAPAKKKAATKKATAAKKKAPLKKAASTRKTTGKVAVRKSA